VLPVLPYGVTGFFMFPGSPTLEPGTYGAVVRELLGSLHAQGFRRFAVANGHSGNTPGRDAAVEWAAGQDDAAVIWHEVWDGRPDELAKSIDKEFDHASWSENFPWTRLEGVPSPDGRKPPFTRPAVNTNEAWREALGDGSFGGPYQLADEDVLRVWDAAVVELRRRLETDWPN
jgi:creatinine amidohydrolase